MEGSPDFANSKFLIYSTFETANRIGGSLLVDCAMTVEEAEAKVRDLEKKHVVFELKYPQLVDGTRRITYITNQEHWWSSSR